MSSCQFTKHGVRRLNPYANKMVAEFNRLSKFTQQSSQSGLRSVNHPKTKTKTTKTTGKIHSRQLTEEGVQIKILIYQGKDFKTGSNIFLKGNGVVYGGKSYPLNGKQVTLVVSRDNPIILNGNAFFGKISVSRKDNLYVVNTLPLEEYLAGVVRKEISYSWPEAAIRAQAIAARSYGYRKYLENYDKPYHLKADTSDQVFAGSLGTHENIIKGVKDTQGVILVYDDYPILTFFHASCGGVTAKASEVWPGSKDLPYFQNIRCHFCTTHPYYQWKYQADVNEVHRRLSAKLGKKVKSFTIQKLSSSGRVAKVAVFTREGREIISGNDLRLAMGPKELRSTKFKIRRSGGKYSITGKGFGHGVGLCQWGAKTMAEKGYSAKRILNFYYHKIRFSTVEKIEDKIRAAALARN